MERSNIPADYCKYSKSMPYKPVKQNKVYQHHQYKFHQKGFFGNFMIEEDHSRGGSYNSTKQGNSKKHIFGNPPLVFSGLPFIKTKNHQCKQVHDQQKRNHSSFNFAQK